MSSAVTIQRLRAVMFILVLQDRVDLPIRGSGYPPENKKTSSKQMRFFMDATPGRRCLVAGGVPGVPVFQECGDPG
jgi:hypothetical protein